MHTHRLMFKCKLTTPMLGHRRRNSLRCFDTTVEKETTYFVPDVAQWRWAFKTAMNSMGILPDTDIDFLRLPHRIVAPTIRTYSRVWDSKDPAKRESYQSFQAGSVLHIPIMILHELEPFGPIVIPQRPPTPEEIEESIKIIGSSIGISPWGSKFGYGRFIITP